MRIYFFRAVHKGTAMSTFSFLVKQGTLGQALWHLHNSEIVFHTYLQVKKKKGQIPRKMEIDNVRSMNKEGWLGEFIVKYEADANYATHDFHVMIIMFGHVIYPHRLFTSGDAKFGICRASKKAASTLWA